jgi:hypothetical protein
MEYESSMALIRRSGESRSPEDSIFQHILDSGFHRNDGFTVIVNNDYSL